jgi:hypothetical protein
LEIRIYGSAGFQTGASSLCGRGARWAQDAFQTGLALLLMGWGICQKFISARCFLVKGKGSGMGMRFMGGMSAMRFMDPIATNFEFSCQSGWNSAATFAREWRRFRFCCKWQDLPDCYVVAMSAWSAPWLEWDGRNWLTLRTSSITIRKGLLGAAKMACPAMPRGGGTQGLLILWMQGSNFFEVKLGGYSTPIVLASRGFRSPECAASFEGVDAGR